MGWSNPVHHQWTHHGQSSWPTLIHRINIQCYTLTYIYEYISNITIYIYVYHHSYAPHLCLYHIMCKLKCIYICIFKYIYIYYMNMHIYISTIFPCLSLASSPLWSCAPWSLPSAGRAPGRGAPASART